MAKFFDALLKHVNLGLQPTEKQYQSIQDGDYSLKRVDVNQSWHLKTVKKYLLGLDPLVLVLV